MAPTTTDETARNDGTLVHVYQLYRGDRRTDPRAMDADDLRFDIRDEGRFPDQDAFDELYDHVGTQPFDHSDTDAILGGIWERWNRGSGVESEAFIEAETRSLEVGEIVVFDGAAHICTPLSWQEIGIDVETPGELLTAGTFAEDTVNESRVVVLENSGVPANQYYLLETQCHVSECRSNRAEWAEDPVIEAVYENDVERVLGDGWTVDDLLGMYDDALIEDQMARYRFPAGRLDPITAD